MPVSGQLRHEVSLSASSSTNTVGAVTESVNLGQAPVSITDGSGNYQFTKMVSGVLSLAISTPQEIDLTAVPGARGNVSFSTIKYIRLFNRATNSAYKVTVGGAASNAFDGPMAGTSPTVEVFASSVHIDFRPLGAGWTVDGTHKQFKFNPGANAQEIEYVIAGT